MGKLRHREVNQGRDRRQRSSVQLTTYSADCPSPLPHPELQKALSCLGFQNTHIPSSKKIRDEGLPSLIVRPGLCFLGRGRGSTGQGLSASKGQFMEGQPCLSQQLSTLEPTLVMRKCPSTLRMVLSLIRQLPSPSLEFGIPCV